MTPEERRKFFLALAMSVAAALAFFHFVYERQSEQLHLLREEVSSLEARKKALDDFLSRAGRENRERETAERLSFQASLLPGELGTNLFLGEVSAVAVRAGIYLSGASPKEISSHDGYTAQEISLSLAGDYFAWLDFIYAIEQGDRFVEISSLKAAATDDGILSGEMTIRIFAKKN